MRTGAFRQGPSAVRVAGRGALVPQAVGLLVPAQQQAVGGHERRGVGGVASVEGGWGAGGGRHAWLAGEQCGVRRGQTGGRGGAVGGRARRRGGGEAEVRLVSGG